MKVPFGFLWFVANVRHFFKKAFGGSFKIFFIRVGASSFFFFLWVKREIYKKTQPREPKRYPKRTQGYTKGATTKKKIERIHKKILTIERYISRKESAQKFRELIIESFNLS